MVLNKIAVEKTLKKTKLMGGKYFKASFENGGREPKVI
jgi:hypothetical protein